MKLGETICRLRKQSGMSQSELAEKLNVSRQSVSKWETDAAVPDLDKLVKMAEIFEVSLDGLVKGETEEKKEKEVPPIPASRPERTKAQKAGIVLLCVFVVLALLLAVSFGLGGVIFGLPVLVPALFCLFAKKHPVLKALWADFFLIHAYMVAATGIQASQILLTPYWTYEMNYVRLAIAWVMFVCVVALEAGTAVVLSKKEGMTGGKQKAAVAVALAVFLCSVLPMDWFLPLYEKYESLFLLHLFRSWGKVIALAAFGTWALRALKKKKEKELL